MPHIAHLLIVCWAFSAAAEDVAWLGDDVVDKARRAVVTVETGKNFAVSGFFATEDGLVITSSENLAAAGTVTVVTESGQRLKGAKLLLLRSDHDLAVFSTGKKAPAYLELRRDMAPPESPCVILYNGGRALIKARDGILVARGRQLCPAHPGESQECWSTLLAPDTIGIAGAPAITSDGKVCGIAFHMTGTGASKLNYFTTEAVLNEVLTQARAVTEAMPLPAPSSTDREWLEAGDDPAVNQGMALISAGDMTGAERPFREALSRHPQNSVILERLGGACFAAGNLAEAEKCLLESLRISPQRVQNRHVLGMILDHKQADPATLRYYRQLTAEVPELGVAWGGLSEVSLRLGDKAGALAAAKKWTELEPGSFVPWDIYALALAASGDLTELERAHERSNHLHSLIFAVGHAAPKRK